MNENMKAKLALMREKWNELASDGETTFQSHAEITDYKKHTISQANALISSLQKLSLTGQRITKMVFGRIDPLCFDEKQLKKIHIKQKDFREIFEIKTNQARKALIKGATELAENRLRIETEKKKIFIPFCTYVEIDKKTGDFIVDINPRLMEFLTDLDKNKTTYKLTDLVAFKTEYSFRLYELIRVRLDLGMFAANIEDLREVLNIPESYKISNIKEIINKTLKEMETLGIYGEVDYFKKGRAISSFKIYLARDKSKESFKLEMSDPDYPPN